MYQKVMNSNKTKWGIFCLFLVANLILTIRHEPWCDEAQAWLLSKNLGPLSIFEELSYEGHPFLWYYILMPFSKLGLSLEFVKVISFVIMAFTGYLVMFKCKADTLLKILFMFSPAMIYFYPSISRSYCLIALFVIMAAIAFPERAEHPIKYGIVLGLLMQTHVIMAGMVFFMCLTWLVEICKKKKINLQNFLGLFIPFCSAVFFLWEMRGVAQADAVSGSGESMTLRHMIGTYVRAFLQNSLSLTGRSYVLLAVFVMLVLALFLLLLFKKQQNAVSVLIIMLGSILFQNIIYAYVYYSNQYRLISWLFILFWGLCAWNPGKETDDKKLDLMATVLGIFVFGIICFGAWKEFGIQAVIDFKGPFTHADDMARQIDELPENSVILLNREDICNSVVARLEKNSVWSPYGQRKAVYAERNKAYRHEMSIDELISETKASFPEAEGAYVLCAVVDDNYMNITDLDEYLEKEKLVYATAGDAVSGEDYKLFYVDFR